MSLTIPHNHHPTASDSSKANPTASFFARNELITADRRACDAAATRLHPDAVIRVFEHQGYCSYTLYVSFFSWSATHTSLLQFRPAHFEIDIETVKQARQLYGEYVPRLWCHGPLQLPLRRPGKEEQGRVKQKGDDSGNARAGERDTARNSVAQTSALGKTTTTDQPKQHRKLLIYEMDLLPGTPYTRLQPQTEKLDPDTYQRQLRLVRCFAHFVARGHPSFPRSSSSSPPSPPPSPSPTTTTTTPSHPATMTGKVGSRLTWKLSRLVQELPSAALRAHAAAALAALHRVRTLLPVVLNHGDLCASNLLVDARGFELKGVVDWAEAEELPFGTCLYGLEYLLGYLATTREVGRERDGGGRRGRGRGREWVYYECAASLRRTFWDALEEEVPGLGESKEMREAVRLARAVGVLLWYGYAWDEGRIDRVVDWENDEVECVCLEAFLGVEDEANKAIEAKL